MKSGTSTYWVDTFPLLRYVPGYLSELRQWHHDELSYYKSYIKLVNEKKVRMIYWCFAIVLNNSFPGQYGRSLAQLSF
jgi:hypothetical protein